MKLDEKDFPDHEPVEEVKSVRRPRDSLFHEQSRDEVLLKAKKKSRVIEKDTTEGIKIPDTVVRYKFSEED